MQGRSASALASHSAAQQFTAKLAAPDELHKLSIRFLAIYETKRGERVLAAFIIISYYQWICDRN